MAFKRPTEKQIDMTYRGQGGVGFSPSMQRARKPFLIPNIIVGSIVCAFAAGVYAYSIKAVKQDDFSDLEDLLPPLAERQSLKSIEDELREHQQLSLADAKLAGMQNSTSSPSALARRIPGATSSDPSAAAPATGVRAYLPRRLSSVEWLVSKGVVERETGNVIVWGAPDVDNVGRIAGTNKGPRLV